MEHVKMWLSSQVAHFFDTGEPLDRPSCKRELIHHKTLLLVLSILLFYIFIILITFIVLYKFGQMLP
jgi:hypothetical protein